MQISRRKRFACTEGSSKANRLLFLLIRAGRSGDGNSAESAEAHRGNVPTAKRTPETGAPDACTGAEFPEAHGGTMKRLVLRAFEDSRPRTCRHVKIKKVRCFCTALTVFLYYTSSSNTASALSPCLGPILMIRVYPPFLFS